MQKRFSDLTSEDKEYIRNSYLNGIKLTIIASKFHIKTDVMRGWLRLLDIKRPKKEQSYNPNPPTALTEALIHNYYIEDKNKYHMSHEESMRDIGDFLGRPAEYINSVLTRQGLI